MEIRTNKIAFTSKSHVDFESIQKHMKNQENNIINLMIELAQNNRNDDVFIKALSEEVIQLRVEKPNNRFVEKMIINVQKAEALLKKIGKKDLPEKIYSEISLTEITETKFPVKMYSEIPKAEKQAFGEEYLVEMEKQNIKPFNFGDEISKVYKGIYEET